MLFFAICYSSEGLSLTRPFLSRARHIFWVLALLCLNLKNAWISQLWSCQFRAHWKFIRFASWRATKECGRRRDKSFRKRSSNTQPRKRRRWNPWNLPSSGVPYHCHLDSSYSRWQHEHGRIEYFPPYNPRRPTAARGIHALVRVKLLESGVFPGRVRLHICWKISK